MKILITGSGGFLGKELSNHLEEHFDITSINRNDVDLSNLQALKNFFRDKYFDLVLHCAVKGGSRLVADSHDDFFNNLNIFLNLHNLKNHYKYFINFGSGAELDRSNDLFESCLVNNQIPKDLYGLSKNIIARLCQNEKQFYNFRIFNVFSENEIKSRMIKNNILKYIEKTTLEIHQDKYMDFIYIEDLVSIILKFIEKPFTFNEVNCVYSSKIMLSEIANIINSLENYKVNINIQEKDLGKSYCGAFTDCDVNFLGIEKSIYKVYNKIK